MNNNTGHALSGSENTKQQGGRMREEACLLLQEGLF
jgi:hypothetical protein